MSITEKSLRNCKLECYHIDTCLPDYFSGDSRPWLCIPIYEGMRISDVKTDLIDELNMGAIGGNLYYEIRESDQFHKRAKAAIKRIKHVDGGNRLIFQDVEFPDNEYCDYVRAYFVFEH